MGSRARLYTGQGISAEAPNSGLAYLSVDLHLIRSERHFWSCGFLYSVYASLGEDTNLSLPCQAGTQAPGWACLLEPRRYSLPGTSSTAEPYPRRSTHNIPLPPPLLHSSSADAPFCLRQTERRRENEVERGKPEQLPLPTVIVGQTSECMPTLKLRNLQTALCREDLGKLCYNE